MAITLYAASGSPYVWRVWLALEHKTVAYDLKLLSFDAGDLAKPEFRALNPRKRVPVLVDDGFAIYESAAIVEYLEDRYPDQPRLFSADARERATQRQMIREADQYFAEPLERLVSSVLFTPKERWDDAKIDSAWRDLSTELNHWESAITGDYLAGPVSAADYSLYPEVALALRIAKRKPELTPTEPVGPRMLAWRTRMEALPVVQRTWPPHWK
jgi:glutathione S-transferase